MRKWVLQDDIAVGRHILESVRGRRRIRGWIGRGEHGAVRWAMMSVQMMVHGP
jgi:hypothetical protein